MADEGTTSTDTEGAPQQAPQGGDGGFPADTPLEQMTGDQREAYWKHQARKHEGRVKAFGNLTTDELTHLRDKAKRHDEMELELGTTADKAAAKARDEARDAARTEMRPSLIGAHLDAAAARAGVSEDDLAAAVEFADTSKFFAADGSVDTDKVKAFVGTIAPAKGTEPPKPQTRPGPSANGQGNRSGSTAGPAQSVASGRDLYRSKFRKS